MLNSLENEHFFNDDEAERLRQLGLWQDSRTTPAKLAFAALMLAPIMQVDELDGMTSQNEFTVIQEFLRRIESEFQLATEDDMESIGTDMGMLPMVRGGWTTEQFVKARTLLAGALERLSETEAQSVRAAIARGVMEIARAGSGHLINLHMVANSGRPVLEEIVAELRLGTTPEGLRLLGKK